MKRILPPAAALVLLAACGSAPENNAAPAVPANAAEAARMTQADLPTPAAVNPALYVPTPGTHQAQAMVLAPPPELEALNNRMAAAVRANPAWFRIYATENPGQLPYHPNLGLSEEEYRRFLALTHQIGLRELGPVTLTVTRRADGGLQLAGTGAGARLNGIVVYPDRNRVETPFGPLASRSVLDNPERQSPTGPWRAVQWSNRGSAAQRPVRIAFGRRARGDMILFYDYGPSDAETVTLLYPAPATATAAAPAP
jgi:hypothetical protein